MLSAHPGILSPFPTETVQHNKLVHFFLLPVKVVNILGILGVKKTFDCIKSKDSQWNLKISA